MREFILTVNTWQHTFFTTIFIDGRITFKVELTSYLAYFLSISFCPFVAIMILNGRRIKKAMIKVMWRWIKSERGSGIGRKIRRQRAAWTTISVNIIHVIIIISRLCILLSIAPLLILIFFFFFGEEVTYKFKIRRGWTPYIMSFQIILN